MGCRGPLVQIQSPRPILLFTTPLCHAWETHRDLKPLTQAVSVFASGAGDRHWVKKSRIMMGWAMSLQGNTDDGIDAILEGLEGLGGNPLDAGLAHSRYLILLAESYLADDQIEKASDAVARAWQRLESNGEYLWESDLCIVEGEVLRATGDWSGANEKFQRALFVGGNQGAKLMELRAATRLAIYSDQNEGG